MDHTIKHNDERVKTSICRPLCYITAMIFCLVMVPSDTKCQKILQPPDTFSVPRFAAAAATGTIVYGAVVIGLNKAWYKDHDKSSFHTFNDWGEWKNIDKAGHLFTAYFESDLSYHALRWTGMADAKAIWMAAGMGMLFQTTVELFDAHSSRWGFSTYDMLYNAGGVALFASQQLGWHEQKIRLKVSSWPIKYNTATISSSDGTTSSLRTRANSLFGTSYVERYLKDYNAQTIWLSANLQALTPAIKVPKWLNVAAGYGVQHLYGGFANQWQVDGSTFALSSTDHPRMRQWYLAPDIDFAKIKSNSAFVNSVLKVLNVFKLPTPAIEINRVDGVRWHWLFL